MNNRKEIKWIDNQIEQLTRLSMVDNSETSINTTIKLKRFQSLSPTEKIEEAGKYFKNKERVEKLKNRIVVKYNYIKKG